MRFDSYHPMINLIYFVTAIVCAVNFDHPVYLAISFLCAFVYSIKLNGKRSLIFNLCLIPLIGAYTAWYSYYNHFGITNLRMNFIGNQITLEAVTVGIVSTAVNVGIGFIFSFYVLLQKERLTAQIKKAFRAIFKEKTYHYINHVCSLANRIFSSFITGQCIEAVILGSMFFVSMTILRLPYAMLVGVLIAFTALIPVFGGIIGCWVAFFLILMVNPMQDLGFLALFMVLQQVVGNLIYPHVVGNSVGLPSIWVLVAVTLGGSLMGIVVMLVFIPLTSVLYTLFREWVEARLEKKDKNIQNTSEISKNGNKND